MTSALIVAALSLAGCGTSQQAGTKAADRDKAAVVHGQRPGGLNGTLVTDPPLQPPIGAFGDTHGRTYTFGQRPNRVTALYFGFTHCQDVCPTTMADLASARRHLPAELKNRVDVVFITVDPKRDTPTVLRRWLSGFASDFVGLRASAAVVHAAERALYATTSTIRPSPSAQAQDHASGMKRGQVDGYQVNHTGSVYVFGPARQSVIYTGGTTPRQYADDFRRLLSDPASD
ncbi:MAG: SCO family protein [Mycobacteriales bacterium]